MFHLVTRGNVSASIKGMNQRNRRTWVVPTTTTTATKKREKVLSKWPTKGRALGSPLIRPFNNNNKKKGSQPIGDRRGKPTAAEGENQGAPLKYGGSTENSTDKSKERPASRRNAYRAVHSPLKWKKKKKKKQPTASR